MESTVAKAVSKKRKVEPVEPVKRGLGIGLAAVLRESETVQRAFGPRWGFALMFTAVLATAGVQATSLVLLAKGVSKLF